MNIQKNKKIEIMCPDNMDAQVAEQCFIIGLKNLIYLNNGNVIVSYMEDNKVKTTALMGQNGGILVKFLKAIQQTEQYKLGEKLPNNKTKKQQLQQQGGELLTELLK